MKAMSLCKEFDIVVGRSNVNIISLYVDHLVPTEDWDLGFPVVGNPAVRNIKESLDVLVAGEAKVTEGILEVSQDDVSNGHGLGPGSIKTGIDHHHDRVFVHLERD